MDGHLAYLLLNLLGLTTICLISYGQVPLHLFLTRRFLGLCAVLVPIWVALDVLAVSWGLWRFPAGGTLPFRLGPLPVEEVLFFVLHTVACAVLLYPGDRGGSR